MLNAHQTMFELPEIVLASGSPRRAEILNAVGWRFIRDVPEIDESILKGERGEDYVRRLALTKAEAIAPRHIGRCVLGADTTVVAGGDILGKPADLAEAREMLRTLSGRTHDVLTGVAFSCSGRSVSDVQRTSVRFAKLGESEIEYLVQNGHPLDKAGAYAVQAQAALFIEGIEGDYWNVVGLPISLVYRMYLKCTGSKAASE